MCRGVPGQPGGGGGYQSSVPAGVSTRTDRGLRSDTTGIRLSALRGLKRLGPAAKDAVPDLVRALKTDDDINVLHDSVEALGAIGQDAADAFPVIVNLLQSKKINRKKGVDALKRIDAERAGTVNIPGG